MDNLCLQIVTVEGKKQPIYCDSVVLPLCDGERNTGGGSYGIHKGHADAIFVLAKGKIIAKKSGAEIFCADCSDGFARVSQNVVTVTAFSAEAISHNKKTADRQ